MRDICWQRIFGVAGILVLLLGGVMAVRAADGPAPYQAKDFSAILGMTGISDRTLQNHFKLYQGYVTNTNLLLERTNQLLSEGKEKTPEFAELRRRLGFEFDGMRLHEYYFGNLKGDGTPDPASTLSARITRDFGSFARWKADFVATGSMRGVGWAILDYDPAADRLLNVWISDHEQGHLVGLQPILVMDVWEHAFYLDTTNKADYIDAFLKNANWREAERRFTALAPRTAP